MTRTEAESRDTGDVLMCNCAACDRPLLSPSEAEWLALLPYHRQKGQPPIVAGRRLGRPYCEEDLRSFDYLQRCAARDGVLRSFAGQLLTEGR